MGDLTIGSGWGWPLNSRKCHYFEQGVSLCGKWMFFGKSVENQSGSKSVDDCVACRRKLESKQASKPRLPATGKKNGAVHVEYRP
jgi:hypothetical protein